MERRVGADEAARLGEGQPGLAEQDEPLVLAEDPLHDGVLRAPHPGR